MTQAHEPSTEGLVALRPGGDRAPLYCVHPVSGSPYCYTGLSHELDRGQAVFGFEAPGFDGLGRPAGSIRELAERHTATLRSVRPHGPYQLLGWSLGGVVAYEMARLLAAGGAEVPVLVLIDPAVPRPAPLPPVATLTRHFLYDFLGVVEGQAPELDRAMTRLPAAAGPGERFAALAAAEAVPEEFDEEFLLERFLLFRTHLSALLSHPMDAFHDGPAILVRASASPPELLDWRSRVRDLTDHVVSGNHHSIWRGPGLTAIARIVAAALLGPDPAHGRPRGATGPPGGDGAA
ncbi:MULTISPECIES: thioesterase domain-containing protein [unclassified Streptomyces]|uniref:thioesterase domain-containing protein n=1 Tax=unclassified Streptomyces TaxID=2593676 RepID=UPI0022B5F4F2|nr:MULTISPECIES: alpha/beta fold hydrolase [unclassified Streptomyces]MCZ7415532.1 alpha/beta fold hydrolase [Streptomyces sp. WMMC897]MCZ7434656.1 alpha/beta fold hydrolase [Streptomyces sp. WMMC1477]